MLQFSLACWKVMIRWPNRNETSAHWKQKSAYTHGRTRTGPRIGLWVLLKFHAADSNIWARSMRWTWNFTHPKNENRNELSQKKCVERSYARRECVVFVIVVLCVYVSLLHFVPAHSAHTEYRDDRIAWYFSCAKRASESKTLGALGQYRAAYVYG